MIKDWKAIAELIGIAAIVASLIFVGVQLRQDQEFALIESRSDLTALRMNLNGLVNSDMDLWLRGLKGEELDEIEYAKFLGLVDAVQGQFFNVYTRWSRIGPADPEVISRELAFAIYSYPGFRAATETRLDSRAQIASGFGIQFQLNPFWQSVFGHLEHLDQQDPPPEPLANWSFW